VFISRAPCLTANVLVFSQLFSSPGVAICRSSGALYNPSPHSSRRGPLPCPVAESRRVFVLLSPELSPRSFRDEHKNCDASFPRRKTRVNQQRRADDNRHFAAGATIESGGDSRENQTNSSGFAHLESAVIVYCLRAPPALKSRHLSNHLLCISGP